MVNPSRFAAGLPPVNAQRTTRGESLRRREGREFGIQTTAYDEHGWTHTRRSSRQRAGRDGKGVLEEFRPRVPLREAGFHSAGLSFSPSHGAVLPCKLPLEWRLRCIS